MPLKATIEEHVQARRRAGQALYQRRFDRGQCVKCGHPRGADRIAKKLCQACTAKAAAKIAARYAARKERIASGERICVQCGKPKEKGRADVLSCQTCRNANNQACWRYHQDNRPRRATPSTPDWNFNSDDLVLDHLSLAKGLAWRARRRMGSSSVDVDDMLGDAMYGLVRAARTFDATRDIPFGAWAAVTVREEIYAGLRRWIKRFKEPPVFVPLSHYLEDEDGDDHARV